MLFTTISFLKERTMFSTITNYWKYNPNENKILLWVIHFLLVIVVCLIEREIKKLTTGNIWGICFDDIGQPISPAVMSKLIKQLQINLS